MLVTQPKMLMATGTMGGSQCQQQQQQQQQ
jgi:hypothetical protein